MFYISHRGNIFGPNKNEENKIDYINYAIKLGFDVEIDVWCIDNRWYLGHDSPQYEITSDYLKNDKFWCHAKNIEALNRMLKEDIHCFWHQEDDVTLTSKGYMWTYPGKPLTDNSICVKPKKNDKIMKKTFGICSDFIVYYKQYRRKDK